MAAVVSSGPAKNIFHRTVLAARIARQILHLSATSASSSGVFLSAPRRTGKTTFMREDLTPSLAESGALVIYVDLWEDRGADPSDVIVLAIRAELAKHDHALRKLARSFGIGGARLAGVEFSLDRVGLGKEVSLVQALSALSDAAEKIIVLIIDEAQHAITTAAGSDAMFSLKSARDELNSNQHYGLRVVCTGSNQDKLAMLTVSKDQAFFGAPLVPFPALGKEYVEWFCNNTDDLPAELSPEMVFPLFQQSGFRPEILGAAADALRFDFTLEPGQVGERFPRAVEEQVAAANDETMRVFHSLTPMQAAILRVMAAAGSTYAPFESRTLDRYRLAVRIAGDTDVTVEVPAVQQALGALQEKGLVWRASRGVYAIEDSTLTDLLRARGLLDEL
jgi:hypothetical protein